MRRIVPLIILAALVAFQRPTYHRLTIIGDSFAGGLYASDEAHTWRSMLSAEMESVALIGATGGKLVDPDTIPIAIDDLETRNPDVILIERGLNDILKGVSESDFEVTARELFTLYRGRKVIVSGIPWWNVSDDYWVSRSLAFDGILKQLASEYGYTFADAWSATRNHSEYLSSLDAPSTFPPAYHGDGLHYGDAGHLALYRLYHDALLPRVWIPLLSQ